MRTTSTIEKGIIAICIMIIIICAFFIWQAFAYGYDELVTDEGVATMWDLEQLENKVEQYRLQDVDMFSDALFKARWKQQQFDSKLINRIVNYRVDFFELKEEFNTLKWVYFGSMVFMLCIIACVVLATSKTNFREATRPKKSWDDYAPHNHD